MEYNQIRDHWPEMKKKIQQQYPHLTDDDLRYEFGQESELLLRLQEKLKKNRQEIFNFLSMMG